MRNQPFFVDGDGNVDFLELVANLNESLLATVMLCNYKVKSTRRVIVDFIYSRPFLLTGIIHVTG